MRITAHFRAGARVARTVVLAGLLVAGLPSAPAPAEETGSGSVVERIIVDQLDEHPGGEVVGNEVHYDEGVVFVAVPPGTYSFSQCGSGRFCGWSSPNYLGSFYSVTGSGSVALSWTARSYSNNRSRIARLYNAAGTSSLCFNPGSDRPTVATTYHTPSRVSLASAATC